MATLAEFIPPDVMDRLSHKSSKLNPRAPEFCPQSKKKSMKEAAVGVKVDVPAPTTPAAASTEVVEVESPSDSSGTLLTSSDEGSGSSNISNSSDSDEELFNSAAKDDGTVPEDDGAVVEDDGAVADDEGSSSGAEVSSHYNVMLSPSISMSSITRCVELGLVPSHMPPAMVIERVSERWGEVRHICREGFEANQLTMKYTILFFDKRHAYDCVNEVQGNHVAWQMFSYASHRLDELEDEERRAEAAMKAANHAGNGTVTGVNADYLEKLALGKEEAKRELVYYKRLLDNGMGLPDRRTSSLTIDELRNLHKCGKGQAVWAQFKDVEAVSGELPPDFTNQGSLVVFGVPEDMATREPGNPLWRLFEEHGKGEIYQIRESRERKPHRFVEFYDVRNATEALKALDGTNFNGTPLKIEYSRPSSRPKVAPHTSPATLSFPLFHHEHPGKRRGKTVATKEELEFFVYDEHDEERTTLMVKNIPNKYKTTDMEKVLDDHCLSMNKGVVDPSQHSAYNFFYMPMDSGNKCNLGYCFVNFTSVSAVRKFYKEFNGKRWNDVSSYKTCAIAFARIQGVQQLDMHFQGTRIMGSTEEPKKYNPPKPHNTSPQKT